MVVKMMKWAATAATRKFQVTVKAMKLEGFDEIKEDRDEDSNGGKQKIMAIGMRWKGGAKSGLVVPFHSRRRKDFSGERIVKKGKAIEWDDEFQNVCCFPMISSEYNKFGPWDVSFSLSYGESQAKLGVIGKVSLNIAEMASKMESDIERKLPVNLQVAGVAGEATLSVLVSFVEIRDSQDAAGLVPNSAELKGLVDNGLGYNNKNEKKKQLSLEEVSLGESDYSVTFDSDDTSETCPVTGSRLSPSLETQLDPVKKVGFFSWKRRRLGFKPAKTKVEPFKGSSSVDSIATGSAQKVYSIEPSASERQDVSSSTGNWEAKELTSRDGQTKLNANVFFASFDQCSDKAAGESACTVLVAVIAHWLQSNRDAMPTRPEFDNLIIDGSSEWRRLCDNDDYVNFFPDKHFDLETVLRAGLRPISVSHEKSFIGFFGPEKFESLKGAMSFNEIWNEINSHAEENEARIYIVSWNDHFFVLKADANAYYIIDTLGERLFEGCNKAYILRFDKSSSMYGKTQKEELGAEEMDGKTRKEKVGAEEIAGSKTNNPTEENEEIICSGKECCKEFIKRFLAAIPLRELEQEEKKEPVSYYSLHQRLQIEFNFSSTSSSSSLLLPFSSSTTTSTNSLFSDYE